MTKKVNSSDLAPCPFCGSAPKVAEDKFSTNNHFFSVLCFAETCPCLVQTKWFKTEEGAVAAWGKISGHICRCMHCGKKTK